MHSITFGALAKRMESGRVKVEVKEEDVGSERKKYKIGELKINK